MTPLHKKCFGVELLCKYIKITKNLDKIHWAKNGQKLIYKIFQVVTSYRHIALCVLEKFCSILSFHDTILSRIKRFAQKFFSTESNLPLPHVA